MKLSASKLHLARHCVLPFAPGTQLPPDTVGDAARLGTAWHAVVETVLADGMGTGPAHMMDQCLADAGLDPELWRPRLLAMRPIDAAQQLAREHPIVRVEVAYSYDPDTGEAVELGERLKRAYPEDAVLPISIDALWTEAEGDRLIGVVRDWKTGSRDWVEPAPRSLQLGLGALCLARTIDCDAIRVEYGFVDESGDIEIDHHTYDMLDLAAVENTIADIWARLCAPGAEPTPGPHCTSAWCPLRMQCSATQDAIAELAPATESPTGQALMPGTPMPLVIATTEAITSPEHAAWVRHRLDAVKAAHDAIDRVLRAWVDCNGPIPAGDGKVWGPISVVLEQIGTPRYEELCKLIGQHLPAPVVERLVVATVSKTKLESECKANSPPRKGSDKLRQVMAALREAGVVEVKETKQYRAHEPKGGQSNAA